MAGRPTVCLIVGKGKCPMPLQTPLQSCVLLHKESAVSSELQQLGDWVKQINFSLKLQTLGLCLARQKCCVF